MLAELWELEKDKDIYRYDNLENLSSRTSEMTRILKFDETVENITTGTIFTGLHLDYGDTDFKKLFLQHFLNREIKWQTLELFQSKIAATFMMNQDTLNFYYSEIDRLLTHSNVNDSENTGSNESESITAGVNTSKTDNVSDNTSISENTGSDKSESFTTGDNTSKTDNVSDNRSISASMPQDQYNIDVENHIAHNADSNDISKNKNVSETIGNNNTSQTNTGQNNSSGQSVSNTKNVSETNANNNTTQTNTGQQNASSQSVSNMYDVAYLREVKMYIQNVIDEFDVNCFLQTW